MQDRTKRLTTITVVLTLGLVLLIGYTTTRHGLKPGPNNVQQQGQNLGGNNLLGTNPPRVNPQGLNAPGNPNGIKGNNPGLNRQNLQAPQTQIYDSNKSQSIKNQLSKMKEIHHVNVIVSGNTALVGYSPSKASKDLNTTKSLIAQKVKQTDASIANVAVSESADVMDRMNKISTDITHGRPLNEIAGEIRYLLQSVAPAVR